MIREVVATVVIDNYVGKISDLTAVLWESSATVIFKSTMLLTPALLLLPQAKDSFRPQFIPHL